MIDYFPLVLLGGVLCLIPTALYRQFKMTKKSLRGGRILSYRLSVINARPGFHRLRLRASVRLPHAHFIEVRASEFRAYEISPYPQGQTVLRDPKFRALVESFPVDLDLIRIAHNKVEVFAVVDRRSKIEDKLAAQNSEYDRWFEDLSELIAKAPGVPQPRAFEVFELVTDRSAVLLVALPVFLVFGFAPEVLGPLKVFVESHYRLVPTVYAVVIFCLLGLVHVTKKNFYLRPWVRLSLYAVASLMLLTYLAVFFRR